MPRHARATIAILLISLALPTAFGYPKPLLTSLKVAEQPKF